MSVFEAEDGGGVPQLDSREVLEVRFVNEREADGLSKASWVGEVLPSVFLPDRTPGFRGATWSPRPM